MKKINTGKQINLQMYKKLSKYLTAFDPYCCFTTLNLYQTIPYIIFCKQLKIFSLLLLEAIDHSARREHSRPLNVDRKLYCSAWLIP